MAEVFGNGNHYSRMVELRVVNRRKIGGEKRGSLAVFENSEIIFWKVWLNILHSSRETASTGKDGECYQGH